MDVAGFVFSVVSLAVQLGQAGQSIVASRSNPSIFDSAVSAEAFEVARNQEYRQTKLLSSILCTEQILGFQNSVVQEMDQADQESAFSMLNQLFKIWSELQDIQSAMTSGRLLSADSAAVSTASRLSVPHGLSTSGQVYKALLKKDVERLQDLVQQASQWNLRLERTIRNFMWLRSLQTRSAQETIARLDAVVNDPRAVELQWSTPAKLRQLVLMVGNPEVDRATLPLPPLRLPDDCIQGPLAVNEGIILGHYRRDSRIVKVVVEFLPYKKSSKAHEETAVLNRVEQLTALLHVSKQPNFRLPEAIGFYEDTKRSRYGIVFETATLAAHLACRAVTLHALLQKSPASRPSLGNRFQLAHTLALALSQLQSIGWVHQSLRSENIAFFAPSASAAAGGVPTVSHTEPWIFGYGSSRPDSKLSSNLYDDDPTRNLYRHPIRWGIPAARFNKLHDVYSLGVILLEIGYWAPITSLVRAEHTKKGADPRAVKEDMLRLARDPRIANLMGEAFAAVTELCLHSSADAFGFEQEKDDRNDSILQEQFRKLVVTRLENAAKAVSGT